MSLRVKKTYLKPWSKIKAQPLQGKDLEEIGTLLVRIIREEAKKEFIRRGWSLRAPHKTDPSVWGSDQGPQGGPPLQDSFSFEIRKGQIEILSSYYGLSDLLRGIPSRPLTELTQEAARQKDPARIHPLVVPIRTRSSTVLFRFAPERRGEAWVHPGIRKFTFGDRAVRKAKEEIQRRLADQLRLTLAQGDPFR